MTQTTPPPPPPPPKPLTAKELLSHPAFKTNDWSSVIPPTSSGYVSVNQSSKRPGGPFQIHYELHGSGPTRLVWIMGLGAFRTAWKRQSKYFGHERSDKYSCLVFDNRGVGLSGKPRCRYSTREMAADVVELLGGIGWIGKEEVEAVMGNLNGAKRPQQGAAVAKRTRDLNVLGVSMGGMIAQELALLIPERIQSLFLVSTAPRLVRTVPFLENLRQRINMFIPRDLDVQLQEVADRLFSRQFLQTKDMENEDPRLNFPTNRDRFAASELEKRMDKDGFPRLGFIAQAIAAGWHAKSKSQLQEMVDRVGGERIVVLHGTGDRMITFRHFELFKEDIGQDKGVDFVVWDDKGHVLMWEVEKEFNKRVEGCIERIEKLGQ